MLLSDVRVYFYVNGSPKSDILKGGTRTLVEFAYDGDDLRVRKTAKRSTNSYKPEVTNYQYDRQNVILETDGGDKLTARYIKGINYIARMDVANKHSYFLYNGHGDVVQTVSDTGAVENQYDYDIFGNPTLTIEGYSCAIRYAGEFYDNETGLYYLRARYYDPSTGRFISEDTFTGDPNDPLSLNLYTYCKNDPIMYYDPSGHAYYPRNSRDEGATEDPKRVKKETDTSAEKANQEAEAARIAADRAPAAERAAAEEERAQRVADVRSAAEKASRERAAAERAAAAEQAAPADRAPAAERAAAEDEEAKIAEDKAAAEKAAYDQKLKELNDELAEAGVPILDEEGHQLDANGNIIGDDNWFQLGCDGSGYKFEWVSSKNKNKNKSQNTFNQADLDFVYENEIINNMPLEKKQLL